MPTNSIRATVTAVPVRPVATPKKVDVTESGYVNLYVKPDGTLERGGKKYEFKVFTTSAAAFGAVPRILKRGLKHVGPIPVSVKGSITATF